MLPSPLRIQGRSYFRNYWLDVTDLLTGKSNPSIPPRRLNISGAGPFEAYGRNTIDLCQKYANLSPADTVIDIGCGIGRTALALTRFLTVGSYYGFDIIPFAIDWCNRNIAAKNPNFHFEHANIFNLIYNPRGGIQPEVFRFPYAASWGTFGIATSLFTHVLPATAEHYIAEAARVLRPGSRFLSTWFLLDSQVELALTDSRTTLQFPHRFANHAQASLHAPERAIAFPRAYVANIFERAGFELEAVYRGDWTNLPDKIDSMQDLIVARKL